MTILQKQCLLCYTSCLPPDGIDGMWGPQSAEATRKLQEKLGITTDGDFGPNTTGEVLNAILNGVDFSPEPETDADSTAGNSSALDTAGTFWDGIKHFTRDEFRCPCGNCGGFPVEPVETIVRIADEMREAFGVPVIIVPPDGHSGGSGVRCQSYNDSLSGSASNSRHVQGKAVDFSAPGVSAATIETYLEALRFNGTIRYWYKITSGSYHMDVA